LPSSESRKRGLEKEDNSWMSRAAAVTVKPLKYGAALASEMISAGYKELSVPEVVVMIE
jgi:hypothetical protein